MNYNMNEIDKSLPKLLRMLRTTKSNVQKINPKTIMMVQKGKGKGKCKNKKDSKSKARPKPKNEALKSKCEVAKEGKCFHYCETKHWKRE